MKQIEPPVLTEEQLKLIDAMLENPYISDLMLAADFKFSDDQMHRRLKALKDDRLWNWRRVVNTASLGFVLRYRIDVKINPLLLSSNLAKLKGHPVKTTENPQKILAAYIKNKLAKESRFSERVIVQDITIVMGDPADLCVTVRVKAWNDVFDWVTNGLRTVPGIENTSTCMEAWSVLDGELSEGKKKELPRQPIASRSR